MQCSCVDSPPSALCRRCDSDAYTAASEQPHRVFRALTEGGQRKEFSMPKQLRGWWEGKGETGGRRRYLGGVWDVAA